MRLPHLPRTSCLALFLAPLVLASAAQAAALSSLVAASHSVTTAPGPIVLGDFMGRLRSIEVSVQGQPATFLLDTGGGVTVISPDLAKRIGCEPWGKISGFRLTGERLDLDRCDQVSVNLAGGKSLAPKVVGVLDLASVLPPDAPKVDGSLALDVLDGQQFTLDLRSGSLVFETADSLARRVATAIEVPIRVARYNNSGHGLGVYARTTVAKGDLWLEIDSGGGPPLLLRDKLAADAGADPAVKALQPLTLALAPASKASGAVAPLPTRVIVRDMIHDGVIGMPALVHWQMTFDLAGDRLWIAPAR